VIVWDEKLEILAAVLLQEQQRSLSPKLTTPPLLTSLSLILLIATRIFLIAKRLLDLETGYQRLRLQRHA
jgi:hypothetical protein